jgi:hypothetical protein
MSDDAEPLLTPLDLESQPGRRAWGLLVVELVQIVLAAVYFATGLWFRLPDSYIWLIYIVGFLGAIGTLIWAIVTLRQGKRTGIPRLVSILAGISVGLYVLSLLFLAWISAELTK